MLPYFLAMKFRIKSEVCKCGNALLTNAKVMYPSVLWSQRKNK
jgi:hypothetical protein